MINWKWWRMMWFVRIERYYMDVWTPWFCVCVRTGNDVLDRGDGWLPYWDSWRGIRLHWGHTPGWNYKEGDLAFTQGDTILGPEYRPKQRLL